jgi:Tol biopolymer transport system component
LPDTAAGPPGGAASRPAGPVERICFSSNRSGSWRIWIMNADGSKMRQLVEAPRDAQDVDPVFSPDRRTILFTSTRGGKTGVWRVPIAGGKPQRICDGDQAEWSPDGTRICFRRAERVFTRELATKKERAVTAEGWLRCSGPSWAPDGASIAFAARGKAGNAIYRAPVKGGEPQKVYGKRGACEPHWAPDGSRIVYETETHVCTIRPDGTRNRLITYYGGLQRYARYSPDGKWLVFCQGASERGPWELYKVPATGGTPVRLTEGGSDMYPDWR